MNEVHYSFGLAKKLKTAGTSIKSLPKPIERVSFVFNEDDPDVPCELRVSFSPTGNNMLQHMCRIAEGKKPNTIEVRNAILTITGARELLQKVYSAWLEDSNQCLYGTPDSSKLAIFESKLFIKPRVISLANTEAVVIGDISAVVAIPTIEEPSRTPEHPEAPLQRLAAE